MAQKCLFYLANCRHDIKYIIYSILRPHLVITNTPVVIMILIMVECILWWIHNSGFCKKNASWIIRVDMCLIAINQMSKMHHNRKDIRSIRYWIAIYDIIWEPSRRRLDTIVGHRVPSGSRFLKILQFRLYNENTMK